ncbi:TVP38/TMEM64 family protein [Alkalicoccus chagannorensis]|uniref:TVP38/TMEM64 family protein n=1 Tax=Alkalicoccus chagannorensis TaxID=427072 RepID=UPI00147735FE|nr:TVP38/TMEM64 family protein [Alkalicoccus chagannorensis]
MKKRYYGWLLLLLLFVLLLFLIPAVRSLMMEAFHALSSGDTEAVRAYLLGFGWATPVISTLLMTIAVVIAPIPTFLVTMANGMLYGFWLGTLLSWTSCLIGAALNYYLAQALGHPVIRKIVPADALQMMDRFFDRYGFYAVILSRVVPITSYGVASYAAGLTSIPFLSYMVGTMIGQTPGTMMYTYFGSHANDSLQVLFWVAAAFVAFAALAALVKRMLAARGINMENERNKGKPQ